MAKPRLAPIYERLAGAPQYHPMNAETFADWSLEAGDIVTVKREGTGYSSPVHTVRMKWNGVPTTQIESVGEKKRESIAKMSAQKYARGGGGGGGVRNSHFQHIYVEDAYGRMRSGLYLTESSAKLYSEDLYRQMGSGLALTTSSAHLYVDDRYNQMKSGLALTSSTAALYVEDSYNRLKSGLDLTSSSAALYVDNKYNQMKSGLELTSSSAVMYARSKDAAAEIVARINEDNEGEIKVDAQHVYIGNQKSTTVINGKIDASDITATFLAAKFANTSVLSTTYAYSKTYECRTFICNDFTCAVEDAYYALQIVQDGNNYKLQGKHFYSTDWGNIGTFSRSISSASWSWAGGAPRVTLSPQGQTFTGPAINGIIFTGAKTWATDKKSFTQDFYCYDEKSNNVYTENLSIDTKDSYNAGYSNGSPSSGKAGGRTAGVPVPVHDFTIYRADGTKKTIAIDVSNIYSTAREGYTQGTFTSLTARPVVSSGGTVYYQAGTAATYYKGNGSGGYLCGTGVTCYKEGTERTFNLRASSSIKLKKYGTGSVKLYTAPQYGAPGIEHEWYYIDSGGTSYYQSGGTVTVTSQGESQTLYPRGSYVYGRGDTVSVTPITGTAIRIGAAGTYYSKS